MSCVAYFCASAYCVCKYSRIQLRSEARPCKLLPCSDRIFYLAIPSSGYFLPSVATQSRFYPPTQEAGEATTALNKSHSSFTVGLMRILGTVEKRTIPCIRMSSLVLVHQALPTLFARTSWSCAHVQALLSFPCACRRQPVVIRRLLSTLVIQSLEEVSLNDVKIFGWPWRWPSESLYQV